MNRKHFTIATIFALVILIVVFIPLSGQQIGTNGDGKTDRKDVSNPPINVNVKNWPSTSPEYEVIHLRRFNITSGNAYFIDVPDWNNPVFAGGYDRFSVFYEIWDMSPGNYNINVSVAGITWIIPRGPYTIEPVHLADTTITRHESGGWDMTHPTPNLSEVKGPYFALEFRTGTKAPNWWDIWVVIDVYIYLRNE